MKKHIPYIIIVTLAVASCGSRKSTVSKSEAWHDEKTEVTDKGTTEKYAESQVTVKHQTSVKEDENVISEETQTDYFAIDPAQPIIEVTGKDTIKVYNANKSIKTTKTTAKRQKEAAATINTSINEKTQQKQQNDLTVKQEASAREVTKDKSTDKKASLLWPMVSLFIVVAIILFIAWRRRKKEV